MPGDTRHRPDAQPPDAARRARPPIGCLPVERIAHKVAPHPQQARGHAQHRGRPRREREELPTHRPGVCRATGRCAGGDESGGRGTHRRVSPVPLGRAAKPVERCARSYASEPATLPSRSTLLLSLARSPSRHLVHDRLAGDGGGPPGHCRRLRSPRARPGGPSAAVNNVMSPSGRGGALRDARPQMKCTAAAVRTDRRSMAGSAPADPQFTRTLDAGPVHCSGPLQPLQALVIPPPVRCEYPRPACNRARPADCDRGREPATAARLREPPARRARSPTGISSSPTPGSSFTRGEFSGTCRVHGGPQEMFRLVEGRQRVGVSDRRRQAHGRSGGGSQIAGLTCCCVSRQGQ